MKSEEFFKLLEKAFADIGIPVSRDNPTPEELKKTIFLFPPKVRPSPASNPPTPSDQAPNESGA
jgi:hypothetical protein